MKHAAEALEILRTAREMLRDPRNWTQHAMARDASGRQLDRIGDPMAAKWDPSGAVLTAFGQPRWIGPSWDAYAALDFFLPKGVALVVYNDAPERTHEEIVALFDQAIGYCERRIVKPKRRKVAA